MRRRLSFLMPSPAMAIALMALLAATGGWAVAASSKSTVIRACANKKTGALRLAGKCRRGERSVSWNQAGTAGPAGATGPTGAAGVVGTKGEPGTTGEKGPQGPGATTFARTTGEGETTLVTTSNGITVLGVCSGGFARVILVTSSGSENLQAAGTKANGKALLERVDRENQGTLVEADSEGGQAGDIDVIARNNAFPTFERFVLHSYQAAFLKPCTFWGMVIPSS